MNVVMILILPSSTNFIIQLVESPNCNIRCFLTIRYTKAELQVRFVNKRINPFLAFRPVLPIFPKVASWFFSSSVKLDSVFAWVKIEDSLTIWPSWDKSHFYDIISYLPIETYTNTKWARRTLLILSFSNFPTFKGQCLRPRRVGI